MMCTELRHAAVAAPLLLLAACAAAPAPKPVAKSPPPPARDWVAEIRAEARKLPSHLEVIPLQDAAVADLRAKAQAAEAAKRFDEAEATLGAALAITPEDPALWQWRAEVALAAQRYADAIAHARRSEAIGPKLGALCVRNWLTLAVALQQAHDAEGAAAARTRAAGCPVPAPIRM